MDERRSARVILLNAARQALLIRFDIQRDHQPFVFWATPGGGVEKGETDLEAARRELVEELALEISLTGPVYTVVSTFEHEGKLIDNIDVFFLGRHEAEGLIPKLFFQAIWRRFCVLWSKLTTRHDLNGGKTRSCLRTAVVSVRLRKLL
jgi:8-oxo-dGTP pyrophosphatase MutT (NUDIX family)